MMLFFIECNLSSNWINENKKNENWAIGKIKCFKSLVDKECPLYKVFFVKKYINGPIENEK